MSFFVPDELLIPGPAAAGDVFGWELQLDLAGCDHGVITDAGRVRQYLRDLVDLIGMEPYGDPIVISFGSDPRVAGFTAIQLITTSNITLHAVDASGTVFLNVFSCKTFDPAVVTEFTAGFFHAAATTEHFTTRRAPQ